MLIDLAKRYLGTPYYSNHKFPQLSKGVYFTEII